MEGAGETYDGRTPERLRYAYVRVLTPAFQLIFPTMNANRRTYRGQSRPTDGNIPHSLSRRNRAARSEARQRSNTLAADRRRAREAGASTSDDDAGQSAAQSSVDAGIDNGAGGRLDGADSGLIYAEGHEREGSESPVPVPPLGNDSGVDSAMPDDLRDEMHHIKRRLCNIQESIQTSKSIVNPTTWEQNCLNAVRNCINEWRSIVVRYFGDSDEQLTEQAVLAGKETSLAVFGLLQLAMQSGPFLRGS